MTDLDAPLRQAAKALGMISWMSLTERSAIRKFIAYLENRKIRLNKIGERPVTTHNSKDWNAHFRDYLKKLECPYNIDTQREAAIFWLASHALSFDYEDGKQVYEEKILSKQESGGETPAATNDKPLETKLDSLIHDVGINDVEIEGKHCRKIATVGTGCSPEIFNSCCPRRKKEKRQTMLKQRYWTQTSFLALRLVVNHWIELRLC